MIMVKIAQVNEQSEQDWPEKIGYFFGHSFENIGKRAENIKITNYSSFFCRTFCARKLSKMACFHNFSAHLQGVLPIYFNN